MAKTSNAQMKASLKYNQTHKIRIPFDVNKDTESDILERLEAAPFRSTYIKDLIRADILANPNRFAN